MRGYRVITDEELVATLADTPSELGTVSWAFEPATDAELWAILDTEQAAWLAKSAH